MSEISRYYYEVDRDDERIYYEFHEYDSYWDEYAEKLNKEYRAKIDAEYEKRRQEELKNNNFLMGHSHSGYNNKDYQYDGVGCVEKIHPSERAWLER
jgi:ABC-type Zn uptake system ZnuABC Zn-binding protein ZnuA